MIWAIIIGGIGYDVIFVVNATKKQLQSLNKIWNRCMRLILGPMKALQYLTGYGQLNNWIHYKNAKYFYQLLHKPTHSPINKLISQKWYQRWHSDYINKKQRTNPTKWSQK